MAISARHNDTLVKINHQIETIEQLIVDLLEDIDIENMRGKERIDCVIKLMMQLARALALRTNCEAEAREERENAGSGRLMRLIRGESLEDEEAGL